MTRNRITRTEERTLLELLQAAGAGTPEGLWRYHDGESEQTVLRQLNERYPERPQAFTLMHVSGYRRDVFGQIAKAAAPPSVPRYVEDRLVDLTERLRKLEAWAAAKPRVPFNGAA